MNKTKEPGVENLKADIVVVGGGGAGMPAAVKAAETGAKNIIVLETLKTNGGNAIRAGGMWAAESPAQKRIGENYTRDQAFIDKMNYSNWTVDPRVVRTHINISAEVIQWLENKGLIFDIVRAFAGGYPRGYHTITRSKEEPEKGGGAKIIETLAEDCRKLGIKIMTGTTGKKILLSQDGTVKGITAVKDGQEIKIEAKAVVIAAGGFSGNKEMMDKYLPTKGFRLSLSLPHKGEGILMAEEAGAIVDDCTTTFFIGPHHYPYTGSLGNLLRRPEMVHVNNRGERFSDESLFVSRLHMTGYPLVRQPGEICYGLMDEATLQSLIKNKDGHGGFGAYDLSWMDRVYADFKVDIKKGVAKKADTWGEMAAFIGAKPEILKATVEQYNTFCDNGYDFDMLKDKQYLFPLRTPPFYAILGRNGFDATFGGIKINERMEVINQKFDSIPGLYAAGNNAGSAINVNYHPMHAGTSLSFAVCSGYIAGRSAAKYVLKKK